ncbi:hypothetical protein DVH05_010071 [Phytophthora capsici]|nr:hypothetical protein DVH05_010071 [Phytophthora capsici]
MDLKIDLTSTLVCRLYLVTFELPSVPVMPPRLLDKFDTLASDYLVAQGSRIRELEDAMRDD